MANRIFSLGLRLTDHSIIGTRGALTNLGRRCLTLDVTSSQDFDEKVLKSKTPVVIDFHASWCGPCKKLGPTLTSVMNSFEGKVDFVKVDVDELEDIAMEYNVRSVPTVLAIKNGEVVDKFIGAQDSDVIQDFVGKLVDE